MLKILNLLVLIMLFICMYSYATPYEPLIEFVDPTEFQQERQQVDQNERITQLPGSGGSSSTQDSHYSLFLDEQGEKNIYFIRDVYNKREFFKNDTIVLRIGVINKKDSPIFNVTIYEEIPPELKINLSSILIEDNYIDILLNGSQANDMNVLKEYKDDGYLLNLGTINGSENKIFKINLTTSQSGKYVLNPASLHYKDRSHNNKTIESSQTLIDIINHDPTIARILIRPNPIIKNVGCKFTEDGHNLEI